MAKSKAKIAAGMIQQQMRVGSLSLFLLRGETQKFHGKQDHRDEYRDDGEGHHSSLLAEIVFHDGASPQRRCSRRGHWGGLKIDGGLGQVRARSGPWGHRPELRGGFADGGRAGSSRFQRRRSRSQRNFRSARRTGGSQVHAHRGSLRRLGRSRNRRFRRFRCFWSLVAHASVLSSNP